MTKLQWKDHIKLCRTKISSGLYALNSVKKYLSITHLKCIYYSLIHSHLIYGNLLWGNASKNLLHPLLILQNKAIRIIGKVKYNASVQLLYKTLKIPKLVSLSKLQTSILMFGIKHKLLPSPLNKYFITNTDIHHHHTRHMHDFHIPKATNSWSQKNISFLGPTQWLSLPPDIKQSHSLHTFKYKLKDYILKNQ